jgi:hypothetical protein
MPMPPPPERGDGAQTHGRRHDRNLHLVAMTELERTPVVADEVLAELAQRCEATASMLRRHQACPDGPYGAVPTELAGLVPRAALDLLTPALARLETELAGVVRG